MSGPPPSWAHNRPAFLPAGVNFPNNFGPGSPSSVAPGPASPASHIPPPPVSGGFVSGSYSGGALSGRPYVPPPPLPGEAMHGQMHPPSAVSAPPSQAFQQSPYAPPSTPYSAAPHSAPAAYAPVPPGMPNMAGLSLGPSPMQAPSQSYYPVQQAGNPPQYPQYGGINPPQQQVSAPYSAQAPMGAGPAHPAPTQPPHPMQNIPTAPLQSIGADGSTPAPSSAAGGSSSKSKIDPSQIPSPIAGTWPEIYRRQVHASRKGGLAPSSTSNFRAIDEGNSNPRFVRLPVSHAPTTSEILTNSCLPLGALVCPLARLHPEEEAVPLVDFGPLGPLRCRRCRGYVNPFIQFSDAGRQFTCNLCGVANEVPREYQCNLDADGRRRDLAHRPELTHGSIEFKIDSADKNFNTHAPKPLSLIFLLDISAHAQKVGLLDAYVASLRRVLLEDDRFNRDISVGFITFGRSLQFYNLAPSSPSSSILPPPQIMMVPDVDDVFVPIPPSAFFFPVKSEQGQSTIASFLDKLPSFAASCNGGPDDGLVCTGAALTAALRAIEAANGDGRVCLFTTSAATTGCGRVTIREDLYRSYGDYRDPAAAATKEKQLLSPNSSDKFYSSLAKHCVKSRMCVDTYLFPRMHCEAATLGQVSRMTGGTTFVYPHFEGAKDTSSFSADLSHALTRTLAHDAVLRMRCSKGLAVRGYLGNFMEQSSSGDVEFAGLDSDSTLAVELKHEEKLEEKSDAFLQVALLYTTSSGERRLRVHNVALPVCTTVATMFRNADVESTLCVLARRQATLLCSGKVTLEKSREDLTESCAAMLTAYRRYCATSPSPGQLILPEALKLLPVYTLALMKTAALRTGTDVSVDARVAHLMDLMSMPVHVAMHYIYPRLYALHKLPERAGLPDSMSNGDLLLPPPLPLTSERVESDGLYVLYDAFATFVWVGKRLNRQVCRDIFGVDSASEVSNILPAEDSLPASDLGQRFHAVLRHLHNHSFSGVMSSRVFVVREGDVLEGNFFVRLVEDRLGPAASAAGGSSSSSSASSSSGATPAQPLSGASMSYVEYLCFVHKLIQGKLSS